MTDQCDRYSLPVPPGAYRGTPHDPVGPLDPGVIMSADMKFHFRTGAKVCSVAIMVLLVVGALGPANWTPRTALGWQIDHFLGYFVITLVVCYASPRPFVVGGVLMAAAALLEIPQSLHQIGQLILRPQSGGQAGCWRRR
jgi:hypothetical protein